MITDAMVERAVRAVVGDLLADLKGCNSELMRKALEAALDPTEAWDFVWVDHPGGIEEFADPEEATDSIEPFTIRELQAGITLKSVYAVKLPHDDTEDLADPYWEAQLFRTRAEAEAAVAKWRGMAPDEQAAE